MNWNVVAAIAQVIAAVAVTVSLVYLALQIKNQGREGQRAAANWFMLHWSDFRKSFSDSSDLSEIHLRGMQAFDDLDPVEKLRFGASLGRLCILSEGLYLFYLDGAISAELWRSFEQTTADFAAYPGFQVWWSIRKHWHTAKFQALVDRMIVEGGKPTMLDRYLRKYEH